MDSSAPMALLVGRADDRLDPLAEKLEAAGWTVATCRGPEFLTCPVMAGGSCVLREDADVTVVYADPGAVAPVAGTLPRLVCAGHGALPSVVVLEGRIDPPRANGLHAIVGALRGPEVIAETVEEML